MKHLHKIKPIFISIFSLNTDLFEMLDQTLFLVFDLLLLGLVGLCTAWITPVVQSMKSPAIAC